MTAVYLSAPYSRMLELREYRDTLQALGLRVVSSWLDGDPEADEPAMTDGDAAEVARVDLSEIRQANILIAFSEAGAASTAEAMRGGRHVEFGYAVAVRERRGVPIEVWLVGRRENVFGALADQQFASWAELVGYVRGRFRAAEEVGRG